MGEAVLVFPAGMPEGLAYRDRAKAAGLRVVGASSLDRDPAEGGYEAWERLPHVDDPGFDLAFADLVRRHGVGAIHAPHYVVWKHLSQRLADLAPGASLTHESTPRDNQIAYQTLSDRVASDHGPRFWPALPPKLSLSPLQRAGLVRLAETIPGTCAESKMLAVIEAMRHAPAGDVVEIGSWCGRSAALLVWLARCYQIGKVLCVDPWPQGDLTQDGRGGAEDVLSIFQINLAPLALGDLNYIRATSLEAAARYRPGLTVATEAFGKVGYEGRIALLHLDGDHAESDCARDAAAWTPHVVPGGWIIFDDYERAFGDGPKVVADAFVAANQARIAAHFKAGESLFVQLKR